MFKQGDIRKKLHKFRRQRQTRLLQLFGALTSDKRMQPEFIIAGSQRSGTTSLYHYLSEHPQIASAVVKEIHYFDINYTKGLSWYQGNFPKANAQPDAPRSITGEASPYYAFHPHAMRRIAEDFPAMKLILIMRNPVDRAYSQFQHETQLGWENLPFEEAVRWEEVRLRGEVNRMLNNEEYNSFNHRHFSYLARGVYIDQINQILKYFPRTQVHLMKSEDFFRNTQATLSSLLEFLELPDWKFSDFKIHNQMKYPKMAADTRARLVEYFRPFNRELCRTMDIDLDWDR